MPGKTFYIETFGCQMNAHDSEKVVGTLLAQGYAQVETPEDAGLVLYNTCSIRDKAEQKVFNRLQNFKREAGKGKIFGVLGCVAQQEGEKIFDRAPHVSLVAGSASYTAARRNAGATRSRQPPRHRPLASIPKRPSTRRSPAATTRTAPTSPSSKAAINPAPIAWCPSPADRSAAAPARASWPKPRGLAEKGYTEIQLLGQNVNSYRDPSPAGWDFATLLARVAEIPGIRRVRYTTSHPRDFVQAIVDAMDANPAICDHVHLPVQSGSSRVLAAMDRLYTRDEYMRRIEWIKNAKRRYSLTTDIIVGFPGETEQDFQQTLDLLDEVQYDSLFSFKYSPRPNTAALAMEDRISGRGEAAPPGDPAGEAARHPDPPQCGADRRHPGSAGGRPQSRAGPVDRPHLLQPHAELFAPRYRTERDLAGKYLSVRVTRSGPNSLVGESATVV